MPKCLLPTTVSLVKVDEGASLPGCRSAPSQLPTVRQNMVRAASVVADPGGSRGSRILRDRLRVNRRSCPDRPPAPLARRTRATGGGSSVRVWKIDPMSSGPSHIGRDFSFPRATAPRRSRRRGYLNRLQVGGGRDQRHARLHRLDVRLVSPCKAWEFLPSQAAGSGSTCSDTTLSLGYRLGCQTPGGWSRG